MNESRRTICVKLFGSLREFGEQPQGELNLPAPSSVRELKDALAQYLNEKFPEKNAAEILGDSAVADEKMVLTPETSLEGRAWVAFLPPVCGG